MTPAFRRQGDRPWLVNDPARADTDALVKSAEFVGWALGGLEREIAQTRERLAALNAQAVQLRARFGKRASSREPAAAASAPPNRRKRRRSMSAAARQRISDAMKKRWAERRKAKD